jgi:hypothetical protein
MSRRPARFTQAELRRAYAIAKAENARVEIEEGVIRLVPIESPPPKPEPVAEKRRIVL